MQPLYFMRSGLKALRQKTPLKRVFQVSLKLSEQTFFVYRLTTTKLIKQVCLYLLKLAMTQVIAFF